MRKSLHFKLLYGFMLIIVVILTGVSFGVSLLIKDQMLANKQQELISKGSELARTIAEFSPEDSNDTQLAEFLNSVDSFLDLRIWLVDSSRQIIAVSAPHRERNEKPPRNPDRIGAGKGGAMPVGMRALLNELNPVYDGQIWTKTYKHPYYGERMLVVAVPIIKPNGDVDGVVLLNAPVTGINAFMKHIYYYISAAGFVAILLALLITNWLTRSIVRPLKAMQQTAGAMARGDYSTLVKVETNDEIGKLGLALNSLAQDLGKFISKIESEEKLRRDFVANVSHELRTPLTIIRGYNEALMDGTIDDSILANKYHHLVREETVRLERLIKELLDLSSLQAENVPLDMEKIPLPAIIDSVILMIQYRASQNEVTLIADNQLNLPDILGNGDRITQLLLILLDNALKYTPPGGTVTLTTNLTAVGVTLVVSDTGAGISEEDLPYIWERFYKADKSRSRAVGGTGLGLAIAREIIDLHHANATITSLLGQGTTITITFH